MPARSVDVVIVNWNAGPQLRECLASLAGSDRRSLELGVVVVDNGSTDGSMAGLRWPDLPLRTVENGRNRGFAAACNQGAAGSVADYLLFLNPDARVRPDSIALAVALMESPGYASTGVCGIQLVDDEGRISRSCARLPTLAHFLAYSLGLNRIAPRLFPGHLMTEWDHESSRVVDHVIGAFYLVRRALFHGLGGFDERFFVYLEDLDFSLRACRKGYRCYYYADAGAYHRGGGTSEQAKAHRLFYATRSRIQYGYKHFGWLPATLVMLAALLVEPLVRLGFAVSRGAGPEIVETLRAYRLLWRHAGALLGSPRHDELPERD